MRRHRPRVVSRAARLDFRSIGAVPEGDTIHRTAAALRTALVGRPTRRFDAPRLFGPKPAPGRVVELVEAHGKHLEIRWDDGLVLHTHMRMSGSWHLYRVGEPWQRPQGQARVVIQVPEWVAVCFNAPVVETYRELNTQRHPRSGRLGADLVSATIPELENAARMLYGYHDRELLVSEALLDQHLFCGVGNVYRSEVLWATQISPFAKIGALEPADCKQLITTAARLLRGNLRAGEPRSLMAYGRNGQPCQRCGDTLRVRRVGDQARVLYWCAGCQTVHEPVRVAEPSNPLLEMDPHPAARRFLADLPWRRTETG